LTPDSFLPPYLQVKGLLHQRLNNAKRKQQPVHFCKQHFDDHSALVGLQGTDREHSSIFPQELCYPCFSKISRAKQAAKDEVPSPYFTGMKWSSHQESCDVNL